MKDPWAEEAQDPMFGSAVGGSEENNSMSNVNVTHEDPFTVTLKRGGGFEDPWVVIRSSSAEEAKSRLQEAMTSGLFDVVNQAVSSFGNKPAQPAQTQQSYQKPSQAPQRPAPQGDGRTCAHGVMNYREGNNKKTGAPYKAYFCPEQDRNQQCRPIWL